MIRKYYLISFLCLFALTACAPKSGTLTAREKHEEIIEKYAKKTQPTQEENSEKIKQDLEGLFPEAGTCPIDTTKVDPDSDQGKLDMALDLCKLSQDLWAEGDKDGAVTVLDDAYSLVLGVENQDEDPDITQQKDDLRFLISKRILEIHASRFRTTKGFNDAIPLTVNKYVQRELDLFTGREKAFFLASYKRSGRYRPMIVKELKKAGLPQELSWLPLIESGFKVRALSRARALGLWQFIPSTGYKFGLKRNIWIDQRLNPEKSTRAAIAYMTELHDIFGDWSTVLAAYNCGERTVLKAIDRQKINYLDNFWDLYQRLPGETARYVPRFIATLLIIKNPEQYGIALPPPEDPVPYKTVRVHKQMQLKAIGKAIGLPADTLAGMNPSLRHRVTPETGFDLKVPEKYDRILLARLDEIPKWTPPKPRYRPRHRKKRTYIVRHRVRKGESLSLLAKRYHTSMKAIKKASRLRSSNIKIGQVLKIPASSRYASYRKGKKAGSKRYVVRRGDTLWKIARRYKVSVSKLRRANKLSSNCLFIGQVLTIPRTG